MSCSPSGWKWAGQHPWHGWPCSWASHVFIWLGLCHATWALPSPSPECQKSWSSAWLLIKLCKSQSLHLVYSWKDKLSVLNLECKVFPSLLTASTAYLILTNFSVIWKGGLDVFFSLSLFFFFFCPVLLFCLPGTSRMFPRYSEIFTHRIVFPSLCSFPIYSLFLCKNNLLPHLQEVTA